MKCMYVFYFVCVLLAIFEDVLSHVKKNTQLLAALIT